MIEYFLDSTQATEAFGARLAKAVVNDCVTYLSGELGTGKTTLVRGFLHACGYQGSVKSPTYTLLEPYAINAIQLIHLDLYRLADPDELEFIGLRDLLTEQAILLVEWPERGRGALPNPDLVVGLNYKGNGRLCRLAAGSERGEEILERFQTHQNGNG
jgi:tRNA threonylcarbamoyladenosine biosynthesis protein TsaE